MIKTFLVIATNIIKNRYIQGNFTEKYYFATCVQILRKYFTSEFYKI